ncbi:HlyD family efflux transporter periplasmic adaptor subunit (plasmid) [Sinorhizobium meliloti]|nr:HlyD family efflux transporter periplasmic adaptor subunit [Sinorhizobium meliloti]
MKLEDTRARSDLQALQSRRVGLIAKLARLRAERAGLHAVSFPADLVSEGEAAADAVTAEKAFFEKRSEAKESRLAIQRKTIEEYSEKAKSLTAQLQATDRQIELMNEQRTAIATLVEKSLRPALETHRDRRTAQRARRNPRRARGRQGAGGEGDGGGPSLRSSASNPISSRRSPERSPRRAWSLRKSSSASPPPRTCFAAWKSVPPPQAGIVANIQLRTPGSAVTPGQPLLDIVPEDEPLLVEMHVSTRDIDSITIGSSTQIRLTAYNQRSHLPLEGKVTYIAADQSVDEKSNVAYFVARAEVAPESLAANPDIRLYPGMPAEVLIVHKSRSAIDYLVAPVSDSFNRAFRED